MQFGLKKLPDLKDAAHIYDYAKSSEDREIFDVAFGPHVLGRPVIAPPGVPADRADAMRAAFMRTMQDAELLAETAKLGLEVRPSSGAEVEALVGALRIVPEERDRARRPPGCTRSGSASSDVATWQARSCRPPFAPGHRGQQGKDRVELGAAA